MPATEGQLPKTWITTDYLHRGSSRVGCSASRGKQCLHFRVGFFPALPGRPSGSPGAGFPLLVLR